MWDLYAKAEGKPLWRLLCEMSPEEIVRSIDFRYITDLVTPEEALSLLQELEPTKNDSPTRMLLERGYPAYNTSVGWMGYSDDKIRGLCRDALTQGFTAFKMKVGRNVDDDVRRAALIREAIGPDNALMMDANQIWDVDEAIHWMERLSRSFDRYGSRSRRVRTTFSATLPSPRAVAPIGVATGEHCHNRVMFKQLLASESDRVLPDR